MPLCGWSPPSSDPPCHPPYCLIPKQQGEFRTIAGWPSLGGDTPQSQNHMSVSVVVVGAERSGDTATLLPHFPLPPSHPFPFSFLIPHPISPHPDWRKERYHPWWAGCYLSRCWMREREWRMEDRTRVSRNKSGGESSAFRSMGDC